MPIKEKNGFIDIIGPPGKTGSIENMQIGAITPAPAKVTTLEATGAATIGGALAVAGAATVTGALAVTGAVSGAGVTALMAAPGAVGSTTPGPIDGTYIDSNKYYFCDDFDDEVATVQLAAAVKTAFWTMGGTNDAAANVTYTGGAGGTLEVKCANADNDSVNLIGVRVFNTTNNPILEARLKIDDKATAGFYVGFTATASDVIGTFPDNCCLVGIDSDNAHAKGATSIIVATNDDAAGVIYGDTGVDIVNDTFITVKIDLTDTEQPRVWINGTEVAAASITGTVKAATAMYPYLVVQNLAGGAIQRKITVDYIKLWMDRA